MSTIDSIDRITEGTLRELAARPGPWVTMTMPTHRAGAVVLEGPKRLRRLAGQGLDLLDELDEASLPGADDGGGLSLDAAKERIAAGVGVLLEDRDFWRYQGGGLVVLAAPQEVHTFRTAADLPESVRVSTSPGLHELARLVDDEDPWYLLAISQNRVRLFAATGSTIDELDLEAVPASAGEVLDETERQQHLQWSIQGGDGQARFHGHGGGGETDRVWLEKFLRQVVKGLEAHSARPGSATVVLAGVPPIVAALRSQWRAPGILADAVTGNPDATSPADLHAAALVLVDAARAESEQVLLEDIGKPGHGLVDPGDILRAAAHGRVRVLLVGDCVGEHSAAHVDTAIRDTLVLGGSIRPVRALPEPMAAITRYPAPTLA